MHKTLSTLLVLAIAVPAFAGHPIQDDKNFSEPLYGAGFYGGLQVGANVYQDYDSGNVNASGLNLLFDADSNVGLFAGLKLGYVFGTGAVRPAIEFDGYYNRIEADIDFRAGGISGDGEATADSGAFLMNFLLRVNCQSPFQLYFGGGVGLYYAQVDATATARAGGFQATTNSTDDSTDFAWQLIAGADYYFTERASIFAEYKFLNYEGDDFGGLDGTIRQHLVGAGVRFHFW